MPRMPVKLPHSLFVCFPCTLFTVPAIVPYFHNFPMTVYAYDTVPHLLFVQSDVLPASSVRFIYVTALASVRPSVLAIYCHLCKSELPAQQPTIF